jgi:hypothetical protein
MPIDIHFGDGTMFFALPLFFAACFTAVVLWAIFEPRPKDQPGSEKDSARS